jgi:signal transduction histidine kinase
VLRPLRQMTAGARAITAGNLHQRLAVSGPDDEFKQLGDTIDDLLARLEGAFAAQRRFVANAAHELRTPLTLERALLQVALADPNASAARLRAACEELLVTGRNQERLLEALLTLATSELGPTAHEDVDLATAAEDALDATHAAIDQRHIEVEAALDPALARGDRVLLERMIANLVENAVRHNNPGGWIGVRTIQQPDGAVFEIANTGPSVPAEQIPTLFEPFARAEQRLNSSDGVGLGLSIASAIARAHDATISGRPRAGGGLEMSVTIPASRG